MFIGYSRPPRRAHLSNANSKFPVRNGRRRLCYIQVDEAAIIRSLEVRSKCLPIVAHDADALQDGSLILAKGGRALAVREICALSDLDNVTVRIADVAANLAVLGYRFRDELSSSAFP